MKISWWEWLPFRHWRIVGTVESADEIPERLPKRALVLVKYQSHKKWVGFNCPCGKGHGILLNLDSGREPAWRIERSEVGRITIMPSIDYVDAGRRCHFHLRDNRILWAKDSIR
jgi:hypothetical protein